VNRRDFLKAFAVLGFPRDFGSHPAFRTEWWYLTGWLGDAMGFQVTFFRARPKDVGDNPSAFAPRQILLAHAAIADPKVGHLVHEERAARAALSLAGAEEARTGVWIDDWRLEQDGRRYRARIPGREIDFDLGFDAGDVVAQGEGGISRKGRRPNETSHYYSQPHLKVEGKVNGLAVTGTAWLDHEWSDAYLAPEAAGWDWCGINLNDGGSLMAFRMRDRSGGTHFAPPGVSFEPMATWKSPRTGIAYPVSMRVTSPQGAFILKPLMDDQELDARTTTGTIYWEGAVRAFEGGQEAGRGYLELTGYGKPMTL
jgi:predicted secreted hydrolase